MPLSPPRFFHFIQIPYCMTVLLGFICVLAVWGSISVIAYVLLLETHYFIVCNPPNSLCADLGNFVLYIFIFSTEVKAA